MKFFFGFIAIIGISFHIRAQYTFTIEKTLGCNPVQDQQSTNTCWSFATTSLLESDLLRENAALANLSEMYIVRRIYIDKAMNYLKNQGKARFAEGGLSHDVIHAISTYGAIPETVYPGRKHESEVHNHGELIVVMKSVLDGLIASKIASPHWPAVINAILDVYLGPVPDHFLVGDNVYTPQSYAESLDLNPDDFVTITSYTHHPFYSKFVLDIPDNVARGSYYNVPLDELMRITQHAVATGHTVAWDGDVSEPGFSGDLGVAVLPATERVDMLMKPGPEVNVTQELRQLQFENQTTTDDHLMQITGTARDQSGTSYFLVKNSWGMTGNYSGYLHMSEAYFQAKTIAIMVHRDAIPADIAAKIDL